MYIISALTHSVTSILRTVCLDRRAIAEQEKMDRDLAMRLAQDNQAELVEDLPMSAAVMQQQQR